MKRSFTSLSPQEALHVAIFIEERNAEQYHRFAEMFVEFRDVESLEIAGVFWDMAVEERQHSTRLQNLYMQRHGNGACAITAEEIVEIVESPKLDEVLEAQSGTASPSARERALQVALVSEQSARTYYKEIAEYTPDPDLRALYKELAGFEAGHVEFLERKLAKATPNNNEKTN